MNQSKQETHLKLTCRRSFPLFSPSLSSSQPKTRPESPSNSHPKPPPLTACYPSLMEKHLSFSSVFSLPVLQKSPLFLLNRPPKQSSFSSLFSGKNLSCFSLSPWFPFQKYLLSKNWKGSSPLLSPPSSLFFLSFSLLRTPPSLSPKVTKQKLLPLTDFLPPSKNISPTTASPRPPLPCSSF